MVILDAQGCVVLANPASERLLGCSEDEVLGTRVEDLLGPGGAIARDSLQRDLAYYQEEIAVGRGGGEGMPLQMSVSPLRADGGSVRGAVLTLTDLTRRSELEEERRKLDRLALLAEISGVMAHEIRNPLAGMVAGIQHLLTKFEEGDGRHDALQRVLKEGERVNRIIEDILLISRPPRLNLAPCDVSDALEELVGRLRDTASAQGVEIVTDYAPDLPEARGDRMRLQQALSNLVVNGIEAMPDGGRLRIAATGPVHGVGWGDGEAEFVEVVIQDNGVGIKEEDLGKVFDPFVTTKARGTGLGLPIAKRIIEEHKGELKIDSKEGEGSKVTVWLPLARGGGR